MTISQTDLLRALHFVVNSNMSQMTKGLWGVIANAFNEDRVTRESANTMSSLIQSGANPHERLPTPVTLNGRPLRTAFDFVNLMVGQKPFMVEYYVLLANLFEHHGHLDVDQMHPLDRPIPHTRPTSPRYQPGDPDIRRHLNFETVRHPVARSLNPGLDVHDLVTMERIPFRDARYIPENMVDGRVMHVYHKDTLNQIFRRSGRSPFTRRGFDGGRRLPSRLRGQYESL